MPSGYYAVKQMQENAVLSEYLDQTNLPENNSAWENAKILSEKLRSEFEVDESKFHTLKMSDRPFLRESSTTLLDIKEGQCGEGTRVLVNLLNKAGYDATRISLYDNKLNSSHTLVSLRVNDEEYLIDSINTQEVMNTFLNTNQINSKSFSVVKYDDDVTVRNASLNELYKKDALASNIDDTVEARFYKRFKYYSYEAVPYTKLFSVVGMDVRIMNFERPSRFTSSLAEKPYLILSLFWAILATSIVFTIGVIFWLYAFFQKRKNA